VNLIVCHNRSFAVYLMAYIKEFGEKREFEVFIKGEPQIPIELRTVALSLNARFVSKQEIYKKTYSELIIDSFFDFGLQTSIISKIQFRDLSLFTDGLRNGFHSLPTVDLRLSKLIYFGVMLHEEAFENGLPRQLEKLRREVVPFDCIQSIWHSLQCFNSEVNSLEFESSDLLLVMRYWAMPAGHYQFRAQKKMTDYLSEELAKLPDVGRLIYRAHPLINHQIEKGDLSKFMGDQVEIVLWEEFCKPQRQFIEIGEPESVIYGSSNGPGQFFGFDSSLNVLVSKKWPDTKIIWPDSSRYNEYFETRRSTKVVDETISWMKGFESQSKKPDTGVIELSIDGSAMSDVISGMVIDALTQERDSLTQERDALTQERDALTQERDALTQERDALTQSTIWRLSKPIRLFVSKIKYLFD